MKKIFSFIRIVEFIFIIRFGLQFTDVIRPYGSFNYTQMEYIKQFVIVLVVVAAVEIVLNAINLLKGE